LSDLRDGLKQVREELKEHFADADPADNYGKQMMTFVKRANLQLGDLVDEVNNADSTFTDVIAYFGEDDKNMTSAEFYGIFKTFVTSYKVNDYPCRLPNVHTRLS
jgi:cytokinesis protein